MVVKTGAIKHGGCAKDPADLYFGQILFVIFINELAAVTEGVSLLYNILLKGDCKHFERHG